MNFKGFDLNLFAALDALLSERSVTRAAQRLNITQPAMSNALQRLRQQFGDPILERCGRELRPTPVAEELLRGVQDLLGRVEHLLSLTENFVPATAERTFRIAMSDYCALVYLPVVVETLTRTAPHVRCEAEALNERSFERLCARNLDFCISVQDVLLMNPTADETKVSRTDLFRDRFVSATSNDHPAVLHGLTYDMFLQHSHVGYRTGTGTRSLEDHATHALGLDVKVNVVTSTISAMPLVLPGTDFIATFPARLVEALGRPSRFKVHACPVDLPELVETLFWQPLAAMDRGHEWMKDLLVSAAARLGEPPRLPAD